MRTSLAGFVAISIISAAVEASSPAPSGFLEGTLRIFSSRGVELAEETSPKPEPPYADYPLVVLSKDGRNRVAEITADKQGRYRVALPPGDYLLELKSRVLKRMETQLRPFTVVSQQTVRVDMELITGLSVSGSAR